MVLIVSILFYDNNLHKYIVIKIILISTAISVSLDIVERLFYVNRLIITINHNFDDRILLIIKVQ